MQEWQLRMVDPSAPPPTPASRPPPEEEAEEKEEFENVDWRGRCRFCKRSS